MGLRGRLVLSFVLVIVICLLVVAASVIAMSGETLDRLAMARLADMALPIYVQSRILMRGQTTFDQVWSNIEEQAKATGTCIFLADSKGKIIRHTSGSEDTCAFPGDMFPRKLAAPNRSQRGIYTAADGQSYLYVAFPLAPIARFRDITGAEWLVLSAPRSAAMSIVGELMRPLLAAGIIALVLSIILAVVLARSVYQPIKRVKKAAAAMAGGKYDQHVPVEGPPEVKELAESFNEMSDRVKTSQQTLRDFVADVSHELRTPLTSIKGFAQAIQDGTVQSKESLGRAAGIIEEESKRMIRLVNNLLELSRLESGQADINKEPVDLKELLQQCQEVFHMRVEEKQIFLVTDLEPLPRVMGDIDRLEQVFGNLLDNALKHTPREGSVTLRGRHVTAETIEINVIDTGPGISKELLPHVFDRFYRGPGAEDRTGTGLGLAISRQIVLAHGGDVKANGTSGRGAEFTVRLPAMHDLKEPGNAKGGKGKA